MHTMCSRNVFSLVIGGLLIALAAAPATAQTTSESSREPAAGDRDRPRAEQPDHAQDASRERSRTQTGGDQQPNAVDPAQADRTGGNAGEGASYSRRNEQGQSTLR
jgi:hypothetical protein